MAAEMGDPHNLGRFVDAQAPTYETVLSELNSGKKQTHWMWFIFPQLAGLGQSSTARFYGIHSIEEARAYLGHPLLGPRLYESVASIVQWAESRSPDEVLGMVDALKLKSCLTLFDLAEPSGPFASALVAFFDGSRDERTLALLNERE